MKYVFDREMSNIKSWNRINEELEKNLEDMLDEVVSREEIEAFMLKAGHDANIREEKEMAFWNFDDPDRMPADARCEYVYKPTYLMTLTMIEGINRYPELMEKPQIRELLFYALNACAGRGLLGSNYEDYAILCDNLLLFTRHGIIPFMRSWPLFSIDFEGTYRNAMNRIERDYRKDGHDETGKNKYRDIQKKIIELRYVEYTHAL